MVPLELSNKFIVFRKEKNLVEAASRGASGCIAVVGYIVSNMIAFTAAVQFLNATLSWLGARAGLAGLTFQVFSCKLYFYIFEIPLQAQNCISKIMMDLRIETCDEQQDH